MCRGFSTEEGLLRFGLLLKDIGCNFKVFINSSSRFHHN